MLPRDDAISADTLSEDEDEPEVSEAVSVRASVFGRNSGYSPSPGGPFSALIPSMWPLDLFASFAQVRANTHKHACIPVTSTQTMNCSAAGRTEYI